MGSCLSSKNQLTNIIVEDIKEELRRELRDVIIPQIIELLESTDLNLKDNIIK